MARTRLVLSLSAALTIVGTAIASDCWVNGPYFVCGAPTSLFCPSPTGAEPLDCSPIQDPPNGCSIRNVQPAEPEQFGKTSIVATNCVVTRDIYTCPGQPGADCEFDRTVVFNCGGTQIGIILTCIGEPVEP